MSDAHVVIVGAGMGGLAAALALSARGVRVTVLERQQYVGGKLREVPVGGTRIDGGPTVFTMRWVFEELFDEAGLSFADAVSLSKASLLARHAWSADERLDLFADLDSSTDAIRAFAGDREAEGFRAFAAKAAEIYRILETPFLRAARPSMLSLTGRIGLGGLAIRPFSTLWKALGDHFQDPRLRQLFGRYATYCGSSPFMAPATLMLVAHVELDGVWLVEGGMYRLGEAIRTAAEMQGTTFRTDCEVVEVLTRDGAASGVRLADGEVIEADCVLANADVAALGAGLFGAEAAKAVGPVDPRERSLSALAWTVVAKTRGFPLVRHSVFFNRAYNEEFEAIFANSRLPDDPTVYVCAQDRSDDDGPPPSGEERLLMIINAPPTGDRPTFDDTEIERCQQQALTRLNDCGLEVEIAPGHSVITTPVGFNRLFPQTGGALYGVANHSPFAGFRRHDARSKLPGLYLAGGSVHPGPGLPMAALSGRLAARAILADLASTRQSVPAAMSGGMSTR